MSTKAAAPEQSVSLRSLIGPLMAVIIGMIMVILDSTVVNVAIPGLQADFNSPLTTIQWTITGYTLALSAVIPLAGWMSDRFGAKRIFLISIVLFTLGSVLCALAQTAEQLIIYRILQGIGGGMVSPIGMAMVFRLAPADKMGSVMGMLGIPMLLAPALGPVLSGWLVEYVTWQWIFLINLPIGIAAVIVGIRLLPQDIINKKVPSLDIWGMLLAPIAFATLAYGVTQGGESWTSRPTIISLSIGAVALILFIIVELRHKQPLLELRAFGSSDFTRGVLISWITLIALFGAILLVPIYLQQIMGYGALKTGLILLPQALASAVMMPIGGKLFDKFGARPVSIIGMIIITAALYMLSRISLDTSIGMIITSIIMMGAGMGLSMMAINTHVLQSVPKKLVTRVTPLTTAAQQVVLSFAVAGLTGYLTSRIVHHSLSITNLSEASTAGYGDTFLVATAIAILGGLLSFTLRKPKKQPEDDADGGDQNPNPVMMMGH
ncbi:DHA2 family efflux MFS transporter permease subunit [Paenibacillus psychroresistens]|uniref:DHA2 family efflux MFS transporter permease subunit n=1 Tax=Paenibacillus psychroresistens TaxID=1778678 RepID=A0A6B8RGP6_9BACL|nr:MDR family MFS transporter [Paenibacillus psychroresistens]QGQ94546.1 DHA2 family efflux MFS transporter permease subunit [Paenibacillus psychroresistens]